jgi:superoxide dismutase
MISKRTLDIHHGKHHQKYVTVTNEMIKGTDLENASLEEIVKAAKGKFIYTQTRIVCLCVCVCMCVCLSGVRRHLL